MSHLETTSDLFYSQTGLDQARAEALVADALRGADDGELYLQYSQSEAIVWDDGRVKSATYDTDQGFGLRSVAEDRFGYAHSTELSEGAIKRAMDTVQSVHSGRNAHLAVAPAAPSVTLYTDENPLALVEFADKIDLLAKIDAYARAKDSRVRQVSATLAGSWSAVEIMRGDGQRSADIRPLVRLNVSIIVGEGDRQESGNFGGGGRITYAKLMDPAYWQTTVDEALRMALVNLSSVAGPAGEIPVVLGAGWPGVLLHEAVGHGLEGDFNRKSTSTFAGLMGEQVASKGVTVVDDGTMANRRGSITIDDEGTPSAHNVLIEDGKLVGYMQDRMNARLMGVPATGNGRRQSYAHNPMPRMTNTFMLNGDKTQEEMIASVDHGIYAANFGGGSVDITSGKFVFSATEAYLIENGKLGPAVKGATLIGNGPEAMRQITMIGNDLALDDGIGNCGKSGQWVPVGVGQPSLRIDGLTVGGTAT
ncbi:MAG: metalloprotease TldD [Alphaproteobacteria bacterium]|nr:metalloprotease TldD [Alphaproteobacteria bacterium SS10]